MDRSSVLFPAPEGSASTTHSPGCTARLTLSSTDSRTPPCTCSTKALARPRTSSAGPLTAGAPRRRGAGRRGAGDRRAPGRSGRTPPPPRPPRWPPRSRSFVNRRGRAGAPGPTRCAAVAGARPRRGAARRPRSRPPSCRPPGRRRRSPGPTGSRAPWSCRSRTRRQPPAPRPATGRSPRRGSPPACRSACPARARSAAGDRPPSRSCARSPHRPGRVRPRPPAPPEGGVGADEEPTALVVHDQLVEERAPGTAEVAGPVPVLDLERAIVEVEALHGRPGRHRVDALLPPGAQEQQLRPPVELRIVELREGRGPHQVAAVDDHWILVGLGDAPVAGAAL